MKDELRKLGRVALFLAVALLLTYVAGFDFDSRGLWQAYIAGCVAGGAVIVYATS